MDQGNDIEGLGRRVWFREMILELQRGETGRSPSR